MKVKVLGSSSSGNCYIVDDELILDCGINIKEIKKALNFDLSKVVGCLVTHEHGDHAKSVAKLAGNGINIYMSKGTMGALGIKSHRITPVAPLRQFEVGGYTILPFDVQHDCAEPLGYLIQKKSTGEKLLFATDTYYLKYKFNKLDYIMIECNYCEDILDENLDTGKIHPSLRKRIYGSHFSLDNLKEFFRSNDLSNCKQIILMHLSGDNSDPVKMQKEIFELTQVDTVIAKPGLELEMSGVDF